MAQSSQCDRPYVIQLSESRPKSVRRLSQPNTVYVDIPRTEETSPTETSSENIRRQYFWTDIDLPDSRREITDNYIEETIFYDPFDDRRIDVSKTPTNSPAQVFSVRRPAPPIPSANNTEYPTPNISRTPDDGFRLPPLPLDTPEPPPAYTEIDERRPQMLPPVYQGQQLAGGSPRKLIVCPCCRMRIYTIVIRESGVLTHIIAIIVFFIFLPVVFCVYFTDLCKYNNHYCPNCNNLIGYEIPLLCTQMVYTKTCVQNITL